LRHSPFQLSLPLGEGWGEGFMSQEKVRGPSPSPVGSGDKICPLYHKDLELNLAPMSGERRDVGFGSIRV